MIMMTFVVWLFCVWVLCDCCNFWLCDDINFFKYVCVQLRTTGCTVANEAKISAASTVSKQ